MHNQLCIAYHLGLKSNYKNKGTNKKKKENNKEKMEERGERYQADLDTFQVSSFQFENRTIHPHYTKLFQLVCSETQLTSNNIQEL